MTTGGMSAIGLLGALVATFLVETTGRRPLLAVSAVTGSIWLVFVAACLLVPAALFPLVLAFVHLPAALLPLVLAFGPISQAAIPVMYAYASEIYPSQLRSSGFGWASAVSRVSAGVGPLLFVTHLIPAFGLSGAFAFAAALVVVAVVAMFFLDRKSTRLNSSHVA